jgi:hypothetical protein
MALFFPASSVHPFRQLARHTLRDDQEIIQLGKPVVPFIIEELRTEPRYWFPALHAITGEDPVAPEDRGFVGKMATTWLGWARGRGL